MKKSFINLSLFGLISVCSFSVFAESNHHDKPSITRQLLLKKPVTLPSAKIESKVMRVQFPKGYKTPSHTHDGPGPRYVVKGSLKVEDSGESKVFNAGEVFWETGAAMTVENVGNSEAEIIIFEMAPAK